MGIEWIWPGARWWKCDFHVHSPGSYDFKDKDKVTAADWVAAAQAAGLDAVAVTDHNTGAFIGEIQEAARKSLKRITVFPAVEMTVTPGVHLLVLFDPDKDGDAVTALLGYCQIPDNNIGQQDACASCSVLDALKRAAERGAICIAAHADEEKGILKKISPGRSLIEIVTSEYLHGAEANVGEVDLLEYLDGSKGDYVRPLGRLPLMTFSDAHALSQISRRYTWVKMTSPTLDGLRLALQDGNLSVRRGADVSSDPNSHAPLVIESIEIDQARYIGCGGPLEVKVNPWLNAIIGGRGTGKSSLVEFLRVALRREDELFGKLRDEFDEFKKIPGSRDARGLLREQTKLSVIYRKNGVRFRVSWDQKGLVDPIEEEGSNGSWVSSQGDVRRRFPVRMYSQKQIFQLAERSDALLRIIDESPAVDRAGWNEEWQRVHSRFLALRAQSREIGLSLAEEGRVRGELDDVKRRLEVFERTGHNQILQDFQRRKRQERAVDSWTELCANASGQLFKVGDQIVPETINADLFQQDLAADEEILRIISAARDKLLSLRDDLLKLASDADSIRGELVESIDQSPWKRAAMKAEIAYSELVVALKQEGLTDPEEFGRLVQRRQSLEIKVADMEGEKSTVRQIELQANQSLLQLVALRRRLTERRRDFLNIVVGSNRHVRINVIPYGNQASVEAEFRALIGRERPTFQSDIWAEDGDSGMLAELYENYGSMNDPAGQDAVLSFEERLASMKRDIGLASRGQAGREFRDQRFVKHLASLRPEALDRLECWFPEDSLKVDYSPSADGRDLRSIEQGSPGQKTAAILAFLLSYGEEPMVLDQPEDDLDNHLIYDLIVRQLRENKQRRQIIVVTHNANIVVNGDAEMVLVLDFKDGQTRIVEQGGLQEQPVREQICGVMEGGREAFELRYRRIGQGAAHA